MTELWQEYYLANISEIRPAKKRSWADRGISAEFLYNIEEISEKEQIMAGITEQERQILIENRKRKDWKKELEKLEESGMHFLAWESVGYPERLRELPGMPYGLYVKGKLPEEERTSVAIVGARRCSAYGEKMTLQYSKILAEAGAQIISGMALGIDGAAHRGALFAGGRTFAVLGCGVDLCYPKEHKGLYTDLAAKGGILSEYPPGTPPLASHFPARNRLISGLADVVLVMEAKEKSGSLITADMALEQGRDVYALPGPAESALSRGCHRLIDQGAGILLDPDELCERLHIFLKNQQNGMPQNNHKNKIMLETEEDLVYSKLDLFPKSREEIRRLTGLAPEELSRILLSLELKGYISERSKNYYFRRI
ncbi:MAG: DNA-processing protein DprA [Bariatricus sp.]